MTLIASRCHRLVTCYKDELMFAKVGDELLLEDDFAKVLGILIDSSIKFDNHVKICKKASQNLTTISRMSHYISEKKKTVLIALFLNLNSIIAR